ncbi:MAG: sensor histidine kinase, partial [Burkholderiales bacterium]|nr:sensor histidine kinase [Burkholderiales bacterium]
VLAARLSWSWLERREQALLQSLEQGRKLEMLLVGADGRVLSGPAASLGKPAPSVDAYAAGGAYLTGRDDASGVPGGPGWSVRVRQPAAAALAPARATRRTVFVTVLLAGLVSAAAVVAITQLLLRRLATLARQAHEVRDGTRQALGLPRGRDEIGRIGAALAELVDHLQREKRALQTLNAELDARVAERTRRIERLADDARLAAVTRERLRLARDLHDTLAHTLMALLTQIRLVRKLRARWGEAELESELARAEEVAATGLAEARNAITQIRHNGVRETGLGAALQELLARFGERSGVATRLRTDPGAAGVAGESAQTVFRIVEEALRNVERHARAQAVEVELRSAAAQGDADAPRVHLTIGDDGVGFDPAQPRPGHFGLRGIEEQAALIGGQLRLRSAPGAGTRIELEFDA